ncbi:hypothetical protein RR11_807 [Ruegeria sp. R11]|nr:hypothetical protein RR11_807 [Ruegeria sp. R11]
MCFADVISQPPCSGKCANPRGSHDAADTRALKNRGRNARSHC